MSEVLDSVIKASAARLSHYIEVHRVCPNVTFFEHVRAKRKERAARVSTKKLICLDTNAWKCIADFREKKSGLTPDMNAFGETIEKIAQTGVFVCPISRPTFVELDSMTSSATRDTLRQLVDELSQGFCITPFHDRVGSELRKLRLGDLQTLEAPEEFLCSPVELLGIPTMPLPEFVIVHVDQNTFNKAFYDAMSELPFSIQLDVVASSPGAKWDNSRGTADLNTGKDEHQSEIKDLNTGIFVELKGCIETSFSSEKINLSATDIAFYALSALSHWNQAPSSRALPTLRVLSSLYGLMRFDAKRRYRDGDPNDFMLAASALPVAHALFTDKKLANLLSDSRIGLKNFTECVVVSGFGEMARYLNQQSGSNSN